jgi:hypothetical protein
MVMGHDGFHCGALTSAMRVRLDILSSIGGTSLWRKHSIARFGSPCAATAAGGVAAPVVASSGHGVAAATRRLRAPGPGDVPLPQSNVRFVIFE